MQEARISGSGRAARPSPALNPAETAVPSIRGLSASQVIALRQQGLGNDVRFQTGRTYLQIIRQNAFTFINTILFAIGLVLILMGQMGDALVTAGLVMLNVVVGVFQEGRAKRKLDQIALLSRPKATVVRDGQRQVVDPSEVVLGDVLVVGSGDQIVVDGEIIGDGRIEVDESLLTGESDHVPKRTGDPVYSGSFCVTGSALYTAEKVGNESLVNQMTSEARTFRQVKTALQLDVEFIVRVLVLLATALGLLLGLSFVMHDLPLVEWVRVAAVVVALVPQGLFFMTTIAYAMGALRVAGRGALIQQANAVESISSVDVLCLDKTGTLTTNRIELETVYPADGPAGVDEEALRRLLGDYVASMSDRNRTAAAIAEACPGRQRTVVAEVPFSSERKWSALVFGDRPSPVGYVLGAPEILLPSLQEHGDLALRIDEWAQRGLRVLLFARATAAAWPEDGTGEPQLPSGLMPLGLLSFRDELRPAVEDTLRQFADLGIELKIISGDNPQTVAALSRQAGLDGDIQAVTGLDLDGLDGSQLEEVAAGTTIFGRITPKQKESLVGALRARGRYVAMIGDGVNDVLSLKKAHVAIAMESGSQAARSVADILLLDDSFAVLPVAFHEGQRIVKGMEDVIRLLLSRTYYVTLLIVATQIVGVAFPVTPKHNSILALLTVGIPILGIAAWARPGTAPRSVVRSTSHFVFPASFTVALVSLAIYLSYLRVTGDIAAARTALTTATVLCGLVLIPFVEPPLPGWTGGDELSGDWRPTLLALGMLGVFVVVLAIPVLRGFFELTVLSWRDYLWIGLVIGIWAVILRAIWRGRLMERWLDRRQP
jgi:cation-transporting ATPase E